MSSLVACWMSDVGQRLDMFLKHVLFCCSSEQFRISQCHTIQNLPGCGAAIVYFASRWAEDKYNSGSCLWKDDCMAHCLGGKKNSPTFNMMIHAKHDLDLLICLSVQQLFSGKKPGLWSPHPTWHSRHCCLQCHYGSMQQGKRMDTCDSTSWHYFHATSFPFLPTVLDFCIFVSNQPSCMLWQCWA